jgi:two-component system response regulator VicR
MKKILICEDEADAVTYLNDKLKKDDYEVHTAVDGKEAIEKAKEVKPDLILLDIRMPKLDGLEVAKQIRKSDTHTKIIFITAFASPQLKQEAIKYNISDYIVKPTSNEEIVKAVESALKT